MTSLTLDRALGPMVDPRLKQLSLLLIGEHEILVLDRLDRNSHTLRRELGLSATSCRHGIKRYSISEKSSGKGHDLITSQAAYHCSTGSTCT